jgi:hypothetical protein
MAPAMKSIDIDLVNGTAYFVRRLSRGFHMG